MMMMMMMMMMIIIINYTGDKIDHHYKNAGLNKDV